MSKKQYQVIKRTKRDFNTVNVHGRDYRLGRNGAFTLNDKAAAEELRKYHSADVLVAEVDRPKTEPSNNFFGGLPEMPWKKDKKKKEIVNETTNP